MGTTLKVLSYLALSLGILVGVAAPTSQAQASRDYYRLDQIEKDFLRFDANWSNAPSGSQSEATNDRARREALSDALREADYVFSRQYDIDYRNTISRGLRYESRFVQARSDSLQETLYKELARAAFEGVVVDIQEFSRNSSFSDVLTAVLELEQGYQLAPGNSHKEDLYLKAFQGASLVAQDVLRYEVRRMSSRDIYDLESELSYRYDRTTRRNLQQFYSQCLGIVRNSDDGGGSGGGPRPPRDEPPRAMALRLTGVSNNGVRVDTRGGDLKLQRNDVVRLNVEIIDQHGRAVSSSSDVNVEILNESSKLKVRTAGSVIEFTTGEAMTDYREAVVVSVRAGSRTFGASANLKVRVVKPAFKGFNAQLAEKVIKKLYQGILWREAGWEGDGLADQISNLQRGGLRYLTTRAMDMARSPEFLTNVRARHNDREILERLYIYVLGRDSRNPVDPGAYTHAVPQIAQGKVDQVVSGLVNSEEFMDVVLNP